MRNLVWVLVVVGILIIAFWGWGDGILNRFAFLSSNWEAVYMADGTIFVGKLNSVTSSEVKIRDAYIIQPKTSDSNSNPATAGTFGVVGSLASGGTLVKWGANQPLKSAGNLDINRSAVVFWESLAKDSEISKQLDASLQK